MTEMPEAPEIPAKFRDPETGALRAEALLKSYLELERKLSAIFVKTNDFDTRSSAVLWRDTDGRISFDEQNWLEDGSAGQRIFLNT